MIAPCGTITSKNASMSVLNAKERNTIVECSESVSGLGHQVATNEWGCSIIILTQHLFTAVAQMQVCLQGWGKEHYRQQIRAAAL
jgi:hypothetical protein